MRNNTKQPKQPEQFLPANLDAERALLGAGMLNPEALLKILTISREQHFSIDGHRRIFRQFQSLTARGVAVDLMTVTDELRRIGDLEKVGGAAYLASLVDGVPKLSNVEYYARIVKERARLRQWIWFADHIQELARGEDEDKIFSAEDLTNYAINSALDIATDDDSPVYIRGWNEVANSAFRELESAHGDPKSVRYFRFGLTDLDEVTSGLRAKELVSIVAPTSHGKSQLALQLVIQSDLDGHKALYFSAEMPAEQFAQRQIAYDANVKFYYVRRPDRMNTEELERLRAASSSNRKVGFVDRDITPARVWAMSEAKKRTDGLDLIVIDYDQLVIEAGIDPDKDEDNIFRHQRAFVLGAKRLAERLDVCVVLLSQLRKVPPKIQNGARPNLDDIWGDSSVRNTPHVVLWVTREFFTKGMNRAYERKAKVYVLKARNDRTGIVPLDFDPDRLRFGNAPPSETDSTQERE